MDAKDAHIYVKKTIIGSFPCPIPFKLWPIKLHKNIKFQKSSCEVLRENEGLVEHHDPAEFHPETKRNEVEMIFMSSVA